MTQPTYGATVQYALPPSTLPILDKKGIKRIQSITGTFQYYTRTVDPTITVTVNELVAQQAAPTKDTIARCNILLDYAQTYPDVTIRYHHSDMCLHLNSDAAYLVQPKARSRIGGHHYLSDRVPEHIAKPTQTPHRKLEKNNYYI